MAERILIKCPPCKGEGTTIDGTTCELCGGKGVPLKAKWQGSEWEKKEKAASAHRPT